MRRIGFILWTLIVFALGWFVGVVMSPDAGAPPAANAAETAKDARRLPRLTIPVAGLAARDIGNNWHDSRGGGTRVHEGIDMTAPGGTPVLAAHDGRVEKLFESRLGGTTLYLRSNDGRWVSYYAHLAGYAPGLAEGQRVAAGQRIAFVGDTGDAGPGNTHLHFALHRMAAGERWHQGRPVNPYPALASASNR